MQESTSRPVQTTQFRTTSGTDASTIIPRLIQDLESDNISLYIFALRQLLEIILDNRESKDISFKLKLISLLNKFAGAVEKNEEFVLSTTILHVIGVRNGSDDKTILAGAATESIILSIFSPDERTSKSSSKALCDLIEENEIIRNSLMTTGFIQTVQHVFTYSSQSSSSTQTEIVTPFHVKSGLLDVLLKLATKSDDIQPISVLIPILNEFKDDKEKDLKKSALNILALLNSQGINDFPSKLKEKDEKIQQLEESNRLKDEEIKKKDEEFQSEKRRADEYEKRVLIFEQEKEKEREEAELKKQNEQSTIEFINLDPTDYQISDVDDGMKRITKKQNKQNNISLTQVLENGIYSLEAVFNTGQRDGYGDIGIIRDSQNIPAGADWGVSPHNQHIAVFGGYYYGGNLWYKGSKTAGVKGFRNNQIVRLEYNSEKGTVTCFLNNTQQPTYISGINEKVRFIVGLHYLRSTCTIRSLKKLTAPTAVTLTGEIAVQW